MSKADCATACHPNAGIGAEDFRQIGNRHCGGRDLDVGH